MHADDKLGTGLTLHTLAEVAILPPNLCPVRAGVGLLHVSWLVVALTRVFEHTEAKTIICWGVHECLAMDLHNSPFLLEENWEVSLRWSLAIAANMMMTLYHWLINCAINLQ